MKKKTSGGFSKRTVSCLQEPVLRHLVKIAGLQEMTMWRKKHNAWHLSVTVKQRPHVLYLSTRRGPASPCHPAGHARGTVSAGRAVRVPQVILYT